MSKNRNYTMSALKPKQNETRNRNSKITGKIPKYLEIKQHTSN